jgi:hypothetical protein
VAGLALLRALLAKELRRRAGPGSPPASAGRKRGASALGEESASSIKRQDTGEGKRAPPPGPLGLGTPSMSGSPIGGANPMNAANPMGGMSGNPISGMHNPMAGMTNPTTGMNTNPMMSSNPMNAAASNPMNGMPPNPMGAMPPNPMAYAPPPASASPRMPAGTMGPPAGVPARLPAPAPADVQQQLKAFLAQLPATHRNTFIIWARARLTAQVAGFNALDQAQQAGYYWAFAVRPRARAVLRRVLTRGCRGTT